MCNGLGQIKLILLSFVLLQYGSDLSTGTFPWSILRLKRFSQRRKCRAAQQHLALVFSTDTQINHPDSCRRSEGASMSPVPHRCLPWLKHRSHVGLNAVSILINPDVDINKTKAGLDWKRGRLRGDGFRMAMLKWDTSVPHLTGE